MRMMTDATAIPITASHNRVFGFFLRFRFPDRMCVATIEMIMAEMTIISRHGFIGRLKQHAPAEYPMKPESTVVVSGVPPVSNM